MDDLNLDYLFHPKSIAIAGVSHDSTKIFSGGRAYMQSLIDSGFKGKIYPVSPNGGETSGLKIYPSIKDIPDRVDYVISAIPSQYILQLVADCATKGVRAIQLFTSGFSEIEDKKGKQLEADMLRVARQSGIRIIGPNCMGLYCPRTGLSFAADFPRQSGFPKQSGPVGFMAQSGGNSVHCVRESSARGVYFSKVISYGNAADLNESDFLEYLTYDPETKIIAAYIEGVKDGLRFARVLKRAAKLKPVIIFKAGTTETGTRTAASHTSAIAGSNRIWESLLNQAGAIQVHSIEAIVDVALLFLRISPPKGRNTAIIGSGGGISVQAADECSSAGLTLPMLPAQIRRRLEELYGTEVGRILRNPVDILMRSDMLLSTTKIVAQFDQVNLLIIHVTFDDWSLLDKGDIIEPSIESILDLNRRVNKPVAVVLHSHASDEAKQLALKMHRRLCEAGLPVYPSMRRAASAINKFVQYHERHQRNQEDDS